MTAPTVAAGAVARKWLALNLGVGVRSCISQIGAMHIPFEGWEHVAGNALGAPAADVSALESYLLEIRRAGNSCGARLRAQATGVPAGLGEPLYDRLDADLAHALMGLNAVKGVEIGMGFGACAALGSSYGDQMAPLPGGGVTFSSNHDGGVAGGISNGQDIEVSVAFKPTSSILIPRHSVDTAGAAVEVVTRGRHDPCVGLRAPAIVEALMALVLIDHALRQRAQCGLALK